MKKIFFSLLLTVFFTGLNAQVNKLGAPDYIGRSDGWYAEDEQGSFILENDGDAIVVITANGSLEVQGKINQRFTPSVNGEYTLKFKARKNADTDQKLIINLLRTEIWTDLVTSRPEIIIDSNDYKEYTVTFEYDKDIQKRIPQCYLLEIYMDGVRGNIWFEDIRLYENNNILVAYEDDFEEDLYWGANLENANSWAVSTWNGDNLPTVERVEIEENTVLQFTQNIGFGMPWDAQLSRIWWALKGVQYRIWFDISATVDVPEMAIEIWRDDNTKIHTTDVFGITTTMKTFDFITNAPEMSEAFKATLYAGKIPQDEKLFIDNVGIAPIHLYNVEVENIFENSLTVNWLSSGYLPGDKLDVVLIDGEEETPIATDVEVTGWKIAIQLQEVLENGKDYRIRLEDRVSVEYAGWNGASYIIPINNISFSEEFTFIKTITDVQVNNVSLDGFELSWSAEGFGEDSRLDIILVEGDTEIVIMEDVEVLAGEVTIVSEVSLVSGTEYKVRLVEKTEEGKEPVQAESDIFSFIREITDIQVANVSADGFTVSWLSEGFETGDKMDIILIAGETETNVMEGVEIVSGNVSVESENMLVSGTEYKVRLVEKTENGKHEVQALSEPFSFKQTNLENVGKGNLYGYSSNGVIYLENIPEGSPVKIYSYDGRLLNEFRFENRQESFEMAKGVYIIKVNNQVVKIIN